MRAAAPMPASTRPAAPVKVATGATLVEDQEEGAAVVEAGATLEAEDQTELV